MSAPAFAAVAGRDGFLADAARFRAAPAAPIPVWTGDRADLVESVTRAGELYDRVAPPAPADLGVVLSPGAWADLRDLGEPLARRWIARADLDGELGGGDPTGLLVVGLHQDIDWRLGRRLLLLAYRSPRLRPSFLSGRDRHSLAWMIAKQWAAPRPGLDRDVLLSPIDAPAGADDLLVLGEREFADDDMQRTLLGRSWRRVLVQGHGKDDNVNLGDFTVCGRNQALPDRPGSLRPRCGYGLPCFKDEAKLIPLREVRAAELVLSACNSGPLAELALYDGKYMLLLSAIDGCFRDIVTAVGVHEADRPENRLWSARRRDGGGALAPQLNDSLRWQQPHPAFWHFGMPASGTRAAAAPQPRPELDRRLAVATERLRCLLTSELLPPRHRLRGRLETFNRKLDQALDRAHRDAAAIAALRSDLLAIDVALAQLIAERPEDPLMDFGTYFGTRSRIDPGSVAEEACACGFPAQRFVRRGLAHGVLATSCVFCLRCGDRAFRPLGAPDLACDAPDRIAVGTDLIIQVRIAGAEQGMIQLGLFVPGYLREAARTTPQLQRLRTHAGHPATAVFALRCDPGAAPQAYYFTVFCVQDLGISTCRQHFALLPTPAAVGAGP